MASTSHVQITLSRPVIISLLFTAALGFVAGGFGVGVMMTRPAPTVTATPVAAAAPATPTTPSTPSTASPFTVGAVVNFKTPVNTLTGQTTTLARGSKGTVIMAMASWCLYCAYEDKYVLPALAKTPGVAIDIIDVSPQGGIGDPGPASPIFSGHDGTGGPLTVAGMETTMQQYVTTFGTLSAPNIHVYVAPTSTQSLWNVTTFPSLAFVNAQGTVSMAPTGAQTLPQAQGELQAALGG